MEIYFRREIYIGGREKEKERRDGVCIDVAYSVARLNSRRKRSFRILQFLSNDISPKAALWGGGEGVFDDSDARILRVAVGMEGDLAFDVLEDKVGVV